MAKKIECKAEPGSDSLRIYRDTEVHGHHATLVIHEGKPERVFTVSEVRALMGPMTSLARIVSQPDVIREVEYVEAQEVQQAFDELKAIVVRLGLYSDPA